ncbi:hypothetical protein [Mucilaginibacter psychrotolerans]|uniref:Uncharacterized protein n=1 Tax=Mucilaginibacter psychrotolerans TaxID=1524096 RepID=A0A4Y8SEB6_9SPHI|nr:hypothetical protein [Mucilaginibacter psychrotolerans]TFF36907.1 hypothetical protein E2R66_14195 [Mucilaginibacter psychrotolerans]
MSIEKVTFKDWVFEVDRSLNEAHYAMFVSDGAATCGCGNCENYLAYRDQIFPDEVKKLFDNLGIDYKKDAEIMTNYKTSDGLYNIMGWFHFKGLILRGKNCAIPLPGGNGYSIELSRFSDNFSIGFSNRDNLSYFENNDDLIELTFETNIPWVLDPTLET